MKCNRPQLLTLSWNRWSAICPLSAPRRETITSNKLKQSRRVATRYLWSTNKNLMMSLSLHSRLSRESPKCRCAELTHINSVPHPARSPLSKALTMMSPLTPLFRKKDPRHLKFLKSLRDTWKRWFRANRISHLLWSRLLLVQTRAPQ